MDGFLKIVAGIVVTLILYLSIEKQAKEIAALISIAACIMVATLLVDYLQPVIAFFSQLESIVNIDAQYVAILLRCTGIGILAEIITLICVDAGNAALGKMLQLTASIIVLWVSLPLFEKILELIEGILLFE